VSPGRGTGNISPDESNQENTKGENGGRDEEKVFRPKPTNGLARENSPENSPRTSAADDEPEQALRFQGIIEVVGEGPKLGDARDRKTGNPDVKKPAQERDLDKEKPPEDDEAHDEREEDAREKLFLRKPLREVDIGPGHEKEEKAFPQVDVAEVFAPEFFEKKRTPDRLQDIKDEDREEKVEKHEEGLPPLASPNIKRIQEIHGRPLLNLL
jgi:hypothetical protein